MPFLILLLFIGLPIAEIAVLIKVADVIDLGPTILLIILTAILGVALLRLQGLSSLARAQSTINEGKIPVSSITDAVGLMLAGAFLLTPGLITDTLGFALLVPFVRHGLASYLFNKTLRSQNINVNIFDTNGPANGGHNPFDPQQPSPPAGKGPIIEGEVNEPDNRPKTPEEKNTPSRSPRNKRSPWNK